jgi:hypothetical protein
MKYKENNLQTTKPFFFVHLTETQVQFYIWEYEHEKKVAFAILLLLLNVIESSS